MRTGHRPAWRRRPQSRAARIAVPLAIPMALGLTLGAVLAFTGGPSNTTIQQSAAAAGRDSQPERQRERCGLGAATPSAVGLAIRVGVTIGVGVRPSGGGQRELRHRRPGQPAECYRPGHALPADRTGGMTPAQSGCTMANFAALGAFVQATILDPATGELSVPTSRWSSRRAPSPRSTPVVPDAARGRGGHRRLRVQRHQPDPGRRHAERAAAGQLRQRPGRLDLRPGLLLQRHAVLPGREPGRGGGQADRPGAGHLGQDRAGRA